MKMQRILLFSTELAIAIAATLLPFAVAAQVPPEFVLVDSSIGQLRVTTLTSGLENPWAVVFLPDGKTALITERPGRLRRFDLATRTLSAPITGLPTIWANGQGGLLDVALDPSFSKSQLIYFSYAEIGSGGAGTAVARARLVGNALQGVQVIFRQDPKLSSGNHFGSRLVFDREGHLFVTLGENNNRITAQYLDHHQGKVVRLWPDGSIPANNPFVATPDALIDIWSYGHRNPQGAALNPWTGKLWTVEHGPMGGDEINIPRAGRNYGWPIITYGIDYNGEPIPESEGTSKPGMEQPIHYWVPSIAPSGMAFYTGNAMLPWYGDVFVGGLAAQQLVRLDVQGNRIVGEERLLSGQGWRIRDVRMGPGDALYALTDASNGRLLKIEPANRPAVVPSPPTDVPTPRGPYLPGPVVIE